MTRSHSQNGSTLLVALMFLGVLMAVGGATFLAVQNRYRQVHQNASWQEALLAAESGIDLAANEIRKANLTDEPAWRDNASTLNTVEWSSDAAHAGGIAPSMISGEAGVHYYTSKVLLREGEGGQRSFCRISVDAPDFLRIPGGEQWYRVRCLGVANLPGGAQVAGDKEDLRLRKFDLKTDRRTGAAVLPQATRLIEAIIKPVGAFRLALFGVKSIDMNNHNIVVDSYDSRDASKSYWPSGAPAGTYPWVGGVQANGVDVVKRQKNGNIATNGQLIEAGNAQIFGTASTNGGAVLNDDNVTGETHTDFYQEVFEVKKPDVTRDAGTPTEITASTVIAAKAGDVPTQVIVSQINLSGSKTLRISGAANGSPTYAQIIVDGAISLSGNAGIILDPGVYVRLFVKGDADITGNGVTNPNSPLNFQVYGMARPKNADGSPVDPGVLKIAGNGGFSGTVYAPGHNVRLVGGGTNDNIFGSFVGWKISMTGVQAVHYDEALADGGLISDYKVVSWFEDVR